MFIREQLFASIYELRPEFRDDRELLDIYVWSPASCRWTAWTFQPKRWAREA